MNDYSESFYGTFNSWLIPEPDTPLTIGWGSALAMGVARLISCGWVHKPMSGAEVATTYATGCKSFDKAPLMKAYVFERTGSTWSDYEVVSGSVGIWVNRGEGALYNTGVRVRLIDQSSSNDRFVLSWGESDGQTAPSLRTEYITLIAWGR